MDEALVPPVDLAAPRRVHVVAVGGAAMGPIARILAAMGHRVSGSDAVASAATEDLARAGIDVRIGHDAAWATGAELVVASTAVPEHNVELVSARAAGLPVLRRPDVMAALGQLRRTVAVAGVHGKTTTSGLLAHVLDRAGLDPSFLVGGSVPTLGASGRWSAGEWFVVEADESDGAFLRLGAEIAVVLNVEPDDPLGHWGTFETMRAAFRDFLAAATGIRVVCADDAGAAALAADVGGCITYGTADGADARLVDLAADTEGVSFTLRWRGSDLALRLPMPGRHNALNAAAVAVVAQELGVDAGVVADAIAGFGGVGRRFERRGEAGGITFVDSFDHLPGEVANVLAAAREGGWRRVVCVFQPHRYARVRDLWWAFADSFVGADLLAVTGIYVPEGTQPIEGVSGKLIVDAVLDAHPRQRVAWLPDRAGLRSWLLSELRPGDLCLTLNAGDLTTLPDELLVALDQR